jgi:hypothetical protein
VEYALTSLGHKMGPILEAIAMVGKDISNEKTTAEVEKSPAPRKETYTKVGNIGWDVAASREVPIV